MSSSDSNRRYRTAEQMGEMKASLKTLEGAVGGIQDEIKIMNQILAVNTEQLKIHIEGVKLAREQNELLKRDVDARFDAVSAELKPIKDHVIVVQHSFKLWLAILGGVPATLAAAHYVLQILKYFKG